MRMAELSELQWAECWVDATADVLAVRTVVGRVGTLDCWKVARMAVRLVDDLAASRAGLTVERLVAAMAAHWERRWVE